MTMLDRGTPKRLLEFAWRNYREFCVLKDGATHIWTRWLLLRAVGAVYVLIFGGSWHSAASYCRSAYRTWSITDGRLPFIGFRLALASVPAQ